MCTMSKNRRLMLLVRRMLHSAACTPLVAHFFVVVGFGGIAMSIRYYSDQSRITNISKKLAGSEKIATEYTLLQSVVGGIA